MACVQLTLLVLNALLSIPHTSASVAAAVLSLVDCLALGYLSHTEHSRSLQPSTLISCYLMLSAFFDGAQVRTLWLLPGPHQIAAVSTAAFALKAVLLLLEATEKRSILAPIYRAISIESTSGIFSRSLFWWLNPLLRRGYMNLLSVEDLTDIDPKLASETLQNLLEASWSASKRRYPLRVQ